MAFIANNEINNIRAKANIVDIVGSYLPLSQKGKNYVCVCPFHDDHSPSMSVSEEKQIYKCFACGATGNVFTFVGEYENVPFLEAVSIVADKCGIELSQSVLDDSKPSVFKEDYEIMNLAQKFFQNNLKTKFGLEATKYLKQRGINEEDIKEFGIGLSLDNSDTLFNLLTKKKYTSKQLQDLGLINVSDGKEHDTFIRRITFPLEDKDGNIVGFSGRIYRNEKDISKYMNSKETKIFKKGETLYNYHNARDYIKREKAVIVVEGFMDAIRLAINGVKNVVALQGTALTQNQIDLLKKLRVKVILCLDNDSAGELATLNNGEEFIKNEIETYVIRLSNQKDPDEYVLANGIEAFKENMLNPLTFFEFKMNYLKKGKDLNNSEDLAEYINAALKNLSGTSDEILREITINKLSQEYNLSIDLLKSKMATFSPVEVKKNTFEVKEVVKKDAYMIGCEKILYFMMNGEEFIKEYRNKLGFFKEQLYREIANEIIYFLETNEGISVADFITYASSKDNIKDKVMEIVNESLNEEVTMETLDEYIDAVAKAMTKSEIKRLKELMKQELDVDKKVKLAMQIAELKRGSVSNDRD